MLLSAIKRLNLKPEELKVYRGSDVEDEDEAVDDINLAFAALVGVANKNKVANSRG